MKINKNNLTNAFIKENKTPNVIELSNFLSEVGNFQNNPYLLIIQAKKENFIKLSIYPINTEKIIKVILKGINVLDSDLEEMPKKLQEFNIVHTSGLVKKETQVIYECYLNLGIEDPKYKDLINSLENIKNIFKDITIVEISLNKSKNVGK